MVRPVVAIAIASFIGIISLSTLAQQRHIPTSAKKGDDISPTQQRQIPTPQQEGDYNSAITKFPDGSQSVLLSWFTNIPNGKLNCHNTAGINQPVIHEFEPNQLLQPDAGENIQQFRKKSG
ncbi:hypothetical protein [Nodularia chucula]|uniref:hypothetical protein n=1 Tax=Nodularia chucula TaxID=3093667 RepID=UPI0039C76073